LTHQLKHFNWRFTMEGKITEQNFEDRYSDPIERQEIDKFVCMEMGRQIHRYIKGMSGSKASMLLFEERLKNLTIPEREVAIARYIDLNRKAIRGLDFKMVLTRAVANYCDTFTYFLNMGRNQRKMIFYLNRIKEKYVQFHSIFEENGKFGMKDHHGNILIPAEYEFLRCCYVYVDDWQTMPVIAQRDGKMGLILPYGDQTVVLPFENDDISLHDTPPCFEVTCNGYTRLVAPDGKNL
jgi:hypothetical protein